MAIERKEKLVALPLEMWSALEVDAERCRRSVTKQIEAIIVCYFKFGSVNITVTDEMRRAVGLADIQGDGRDKTPPDNPGTPGEHRMITVPLSTATPRRKKTQDKRKIAGKE